MSSAERICQRRNSRSGFLRVSNQCFRRSPLELIPSWTPPNRPHKEKCSCLLLMWSGNSCTVENFQTVIVKCVIPKSTWVQSSSGSGERSQIYALVSDFCKLSNVLPTTINWNPDFELVQHLFFWNYSSIGIDVAYWFTLNWVISIFVFINVTRYKALS